MRWNRHSTAAVELGFFLAVAWALYGPHLGGPYFLDSVSSVARDPDITQDLWTYLTECKKSFYLYRPVNRLTFWLDHRLPGHPRAFNICLLGLSGFALGELIRRAYGRMPTFWALLWMCHPLLVQGTQYVCQRPVLLCALFSFMALDAHLRGSRWFWPWCALAMGSKEIGAMVPLAAIMLPPRPFRKQAIPAGHMLVVIGVVLLGISVIVPPEVASGKGFTVAERLLMQPEAFRTYLTAVIFPVPSALSLERPLSFPGVDPWGVLLIVCVLFLTLRVKERWLWVSWMGFLPEAGPFALEPIFDHRAILPMAWLTVVSSRRLHLGVSLLTPLLVACTILTSTWLWYWDDDRRLYEHGAEVSDSWRAWYNLGAAYTDRATASTVPAEWPVYSGRALGPLRRSVGLRREHGSTWVNLGASLWRVGEYDEGVHWMTQAARLSPGAKGNLERMMREAVFERLPLSEETAVAAIEVLMEGKR